MSQVFVIAELKSRIGQEILLSDWISITQDEIDSFGRLTRDIDPMHMDPAYAARSSPFGTTIVYGFQVLAMLSHLCAPLRGMRLRGRSGYDLNYGFNRIRFVSPVPVDTPFRNRVVLKGLQERGDNAFLITTLNTIEIRGRDRPALVAEWLGLIAQDLETSPLP